EAETLDHEAAPSPSSETETVEHEAAADELALMSEETDVDGKEPTSEAATSDEELESKGPSDDDGLSTDLEAVDPPGEEAVDEGADESTDGVPEESLDQETFPPMDSDRADISGYEDTLLGTEGAPEQYLREVGGPEGEEFPYAETLLATEQVLEEQPDVADPGAETLLVTERVEQPEDTPESASETVPPIEESESSEALTEGQSQDEATVSDLDDDSEEEQASGGDTQVLPETSPDEGEAGSQSEDGEPSTRETLEPDDLVKLVDAEHPDGSPDNGEVDLLPLPPDQEGLLDERQQGDDAGELADDLFAAIDQDRPVSQSASAPEGEDKAFFKKAMRGAPRLQSLTHIEAPSSAEMQEIRQEFSVVARLEQSKKKTQLLIFAILGLLAGAVVAGVFLFQEQSARKKAETVESFKSSSDNVPTVSRKARYESQVHEAAPEPEEPEEPEIAEPPPVAAIPAPVAPKPSAPPKKKFKKLSKAQMALLQQDDVGVTPKLKRDPGAEARKAAEKKAKERRTQMASARTEKVVETFARKRRQLARCKGEEEEKVKVIFTIGANGRVTDVKVKGAEDPEKGKCIKDILKRAIFPSGAETETFSMPVTL
ncbi:MAG: hypothetical protein VX938_01855, partial [Myxococcota bacterium]|nr:hypothetical protein [Myxococcota bacterium]